jgi:hypothetical protein
MRRKRKYDVDMTRTDGKGLNEQIRPAKSDKISDYCEYLGLKRYKCVILMVKHLLDDNGLPYTYISAGQKLDALTRGTNEDLNKLQSLVTLLKSLE